MKRARPPYPILNLLLHVPVLAGLGVLLAALAYSAWSMLAGPDAPSRWTASSIPPMLLLPAILLPVLDIAAVLLVSVGRDVLREHRNVVRQARRAFAQAAHSTDALPRPASAPAGDTLLRPAHHAAATDRDTLPRPLPHRAGPR